MAAIARTESGLDPLEINDNTTGFSVEPPTVADAVSLATSLIVAGHSVDVGLMQINSANFQALDVTAAAALDPCRSLAAGAQILGAGYAGGLTHAAQQSALRVALSRYNTGDAQRGFANGYVQRVVQSARVVVPAIDPIPEAAPSNHVSIAKSPEEAPVRSQPSASTGAGDGASPWLVWADDGETVSKRGSPVAGASQQTDITADEGQGASAAVTNYASLAAK